MTTKLELLQHLNTKSAFLNYPTSSNSKQPPTTNILNRFFFETPKTKPKPFPKPPTSPTMTASTKTTPINMYNKISINKKSIDLPRNSNLKFNKHIKASPSTSLNSNNNSQNTSKTITVNQSVNIKDKISLTRSVSPVSTSPPMSAIAVAKHKHKHNLYKKNTPLRQPPPTFLHITSKTPINTVRSTSNSTRRKISVNSSKSPNIQTRSKSNNNYKPFMKSSNSNNNSNSSRCTAYTNRTLRKSPSPISIASSSSTIRKQSHSPFHTEFPYNRNTSKGNNSKTTYSNCNSACSSNKKCFKKIKTVSPLSAKTKTTARISKNKSPTNSVNNANKNNNNNIKVNQVNNITVKDIKNGLTASSSRNDNFNLKQNKYSHLHHNNNNNNNNNNRHHQLQQHNPQQSSIISTLCSNNSNNISSLKIKKPNISVISKMGINSIYELPKQDNQDNYFITHYDDMQIHFIGVCDGHGTYGHLVSHFIKETLPHCLHKELLNKSIISSSSTSTTPTSVLHPSMIKRSIENAFVQTNSKLSNNASIDTNFSGSTCVSLVIANECIYTANVGDSRAIICKQHGSNAIWESESLTRDHKANEVDECKRIERFGGRIEQYKDEHGVYIGPKRVWLKNDPVPGLAMTRSFGDQIASSVGVVSDPEIKERTLKEEDKVIIIASDGLWEYVTNEEVCDIVKDVYTCKNSNTNSNSDKLCQMLYKAAYKKWKENDDSVDDITIIAMCYD